MEAKRLFESNSFKENAHEAEQDFRETSLWYESEFFIPDQTSSQAYQNYINNSHKAKSLYLMTEGNNFTTQLIIYDTESKREEVKILKTPIPLYLNTCLTLLPNGELLCFCEFWIQEQVFIIDNNYDVRLNPSGLPLLNSSAICFNSDIYCFGGVDKLLPVAFSMRFDLNKNQWINLTPMPKADFFCHSVIFNDNILISGYCCTNLMLYCVDIDSFSIISYEFLYNRRKILINAEKLYLIECNGFIYESENGFAWNKISRSEIKNDYPSQVYCLYNKGAIYILTDSPGERYFKFDIKQKTITKS